MPRFHFHLCKENLSLSAVAEEVPGKAMAITTAQGMARELLVDIEGGWSSARIEVADEHGDVISIVHVSDCWLQ